MWGDTTLFALLSCCSGALRSWTYMKVEAVAGLQFPHEILGHVWVNNTVPEMRRKFLAVRWGRNICGLVWTRRWPDSPGHWEWSTLAEEAMTRCEIRLTDREYGLHSLCGVAFSLGLCSEGKKKSISLPLLSSNSMPRIALQGLSRGKLITPFDWWCLTHLRAISYRSLIYLHISSREGPRAKPRTLMPQAFKKFRRASEFSCINCLVSILPLTVNLLYPSIPCSLRPLPNKPSPE